MLCCMIPLFWNPKYLSVHFRGVGRGEEKVYCLYTHENVDIFEWPLSVLLNDLIMCHAFLTDLTIYHYAANMSNIKVLLNDLTMCHAFLSWPDHLLLCCHQLVYNMSEHCLHGILYLMVTTIFWSSRS